MRFLILLCVLFVTACDNPVEPVLFESEREVLWTGGFRMDDGRYVWIAGHGSGSREYICQISLEVADELEKGDLLTCTWRLNNKPHSEIDWDESLMS